MTPLVFEAYFQVIRMGRRLRSGDFQSFYEILRSQQVGREFAADGTIEKVCLAIDTACTWYWKEINCLHRSSATVWLLRKHGVPAKLLIGAQQMPFRAHAWVEVHGHVVNDKPYVKEIYSVLDCC